ncbi:glutathione S-transferase family protein [Salinisphaera hydrothermalis]|uniref:Glutathione S-transferase-like protein n=1 Tax=Salinisphaera hydrothermalis (strain C41B8) TaxID=1304275 RepID=A0A084INB6_SALHC|nr:glutathione S-transferase family protein [Salinisphaera hydrothermalis]KEZ78200.1 glutathione S-transferase-like protein [Salinisphaera hydrothermalis C41B8]
MNADLIFYTNPMSRGRIVRWMLEETGATYDTEILDYATSMKAPAYLAINPMGKVPAIVHSGQVVTECAAICAYLADVFPDAGLAPPVTARAAYYRWLFFAAGPLEQAEINRYLGVTPTEQQARMAGYGRYELVVDVLDQMLSANPYVSDSGFSAADVYVGAHVIWGLQFGSLPERDAFKLYAARLTEREAYQRATAKDEALMPPPAPPIG